MEIEARIDERGESRLTQRGEVRLPHVLIQYMLAQKVKLPRLLSNDTVVAETVDRVAHLLLPRKTSAPG